MKKAYFKHIFSLILFGTNGLVASKIMLSSYEIVFFRTLVGSLTLILLFLISRQRVTFTKHKSQLAFILLSGIAMGTSWMFLYEAYKQIGVSISTLANYCGPVIVMALSPLLFKESLTFKKILGFATVLLGLVFVNGKLVNEGGNAWGIFCGIMSAVTYAFLMIFNKKAKDIKGLENTMLQLLAGFLTLAVFIGVKQHFIIHIKPSDIPYILILGIINTGLGCYLFFSSINVLSIQTVSICGYIEPLAAVVFSCLILHEIMTPLQILGGILILGGAIFAELSSKRLKSASN